jgi:hypothetical protein
MYEGDEKCTDNERKPLDTPKPIWGDNIKTDRKEQNIRLWIGCSWLETKPQLQTYADSTISKMQV